MYKLEILPIAKKDMDDIIYYISHNLNNITAFQKIYRKIKKERTRV